MLYLASRPLGVASRSARMRTQSRSCQGTGRGDAWSARARSGTDRRTVTELRPYVYRPVPLHPHAAAVAPICPAQATECEATSRPTHRGYISFGE
ncbi:hypothetical protein E2562_006638 [Oryza meyeriana var. granulata]|uniref:Uncharacterized protein n=1 Tax=Oryza meyeriana var. granulata TaxID=110450 RepID=A0A6G1EFU3_9ORYZ|nr:hypothetical protein E2562_006638 [Oryza meyeriana var. granulata]